MPGQPVSTARLRTLQDALGLSETSKYVEAQHRLNMIRNTQKYLVGSKGKEEKNLKILFPKAPILTQIGIDPLQSSSGRTRTLRYRRSRNATSISSLSHIIDAVELCSWGRIRSKRAQIQKINSDTVSDTPGGRWTFPNRSKISTLQVGTQLQDVYPFCHLCLI